MESYWQLNASEVFIIVLIILLIIVFAIVAVFLWRAKKGNALNSRTKGIVKTKKFSPQPPDPYKAASIKFNDDACDAVKSIGAKRFLDAERVIPSLPLSGCDAQECSCRYERHKDRRTFSEDRRNPSPLHSDLRESVGETNRRQKKRGRRKDDWA
jgi:hypothetical protein